MQRELGRHDIKMIIICHRKQFLQQAWWWQVEANYQSLKRSPTGFRIWLLFSSNFALFKPKVCCHLCDPGEHPDVCKDAPWRNIHDGITTQLLCHNSCLFNYKACWKVWRWWQLLCAVLKDGSNSKSVSIEIQLFRWSVLSRLKRKALWIEHLVKKMETHR